MGSAFRNPVITDDDGVDHGDPFVVRHLGDYWLYHTTDDGDRDRIRDSDGIHMTTEGAELLASAVLEPVIAQLTGG